MLAGQREKASANDPTPNAALIACLMDLEAGEAVSVLERAWATGNVDELIAAGWEDMRYELGWGQPPFADPLVRSSPLR